MRQIIQEGTRQGARGGPNRKGWKNPLGKNHACTVRKKDIKRDECPNKGKKEKVTVAAAKSKEAYNLETNTAWEMSLTEADRAPF
jgi:hypothetical protein